VFRKYFSALEEYRLRVFENCETGSQIQEVTGGWRKLYDEEIHSLFFTEYFISVIKSDVMRWAAHVTRIG
jgi:hypothetical protein